MKLHRLRVEHVRGIGQAEVCFDGGVTVIEAPNESGKTSLFDAFDLLLQEKSSSKKQVIRDLMPAGSDAGSVVEADLTLGSTQLTVRKQFNRSHMTQLQQHAPIKRDYSGEDAHNRLQELLEEHTDMALFRALWFRQGAQLEAIGDLTTSEHLAERLDASAGGSGDIGDDALYARIVEHFKRYFTDTGKPKRDPFGVVDDAVAQIDAQVEQLETKAQQLATASEQLRSGQAEQQRLDAELAELKPAIRKHDALLRRIETLRHELSAAQAVRATAAGRLEQTTKDHQARKDLLADIDHLQERLVTATTTQQETSVSLERLVAQQVEAREQLDAAKATEQEARDAATTARAAADLEIERAKLVDLRERAARITQALDKGQAAETFLVNNPMSTQQHTAIKDAAEHLRFVERELGQAAPTVTIRADDDHDIKVNGETHTASDASSTLSVPDELTVIVDGVEVTVKAGASLQERHANVAHAREQLEQACAAVGVPDPAAADALAQEIAERRRAIAERDAVVARELRGGSREQLHDEIRQVQAHIAHLETAVNTDDDDEQLKLVADTPVGSSATVEACVAAEDAARAALSTARSAYEAITQDLQRLRDVATEARTHAEHVRDQLAAAREQLEAVRRDQPDEHIADRVSEAQRELKVEDDKLASAQHELAELDPDNVELMAKNTDQRRQRVEDDLETVTTQVHQLRATIEVQGGQGLGEHLDHAKAEQQRVHERRRSLHARAAAARTLKETFDAARDAAYTAYREPLRERIGRAGKLVYGPDFDVELDETLAVAHRTLDGTTLATAKLSAGAREQLTILTALATADLAGEDGVPLVLDDTLGYSDPDRLERIGALMGRMRGPQIIVLTCVGSRFRAVGGANVIRLADHAKAVRQP